MKLLLRVNIAALAFALLTTSASAMDGYFFGDYDYIKPSGHSLNGFDTGLGLAFNEHVGTELGYIHAAGHGISANGGFLDFAYHQPLGFARGLSLYGTVGGEYIAAHSYNWGVRAGGGLEFWLRNGLGLRVGASYHSAFDHAVVGNAGVIVRF